MPHLRAGMRSVEAVQPEPAVTVSAALHARVVAAGTMPSSCPPRAVPEEVKRQPGRRRRLPSASMLKSRIAHTCGRLEPRRASPRETHAAIVERADAAPRWREGSAPIGA
jgi:hypothetical protein